VQRKKISIKKYYRIVGFAFITGIFLRQLLIPIVGFITSYKTGLEMLDIKMVELNNILSGAEITERSAMNAYGYKIRQEMSYEGFLNSPFLGGEQSGGHHFWIDGLAEHGIIGMLPIVAILVYFFTWAKDYLNSVGQLFLFHSYMVFVFIGLFKNIPFTLVSALLFFVPMILFSFPYFKNTTSPSNA
jgi:hypothetical protein